MQEIPMPYVKANQIGIILFIILATILYQPWLFALLWIIQIFGLVFGFNLFVQIAKPFIRVKGVETQALELQRFNNIIGIIFLTLSLICFSIHLTLVGYIFSLMLAIAAFVAICGYCIGCTIYYQYKRLVKAKRK